MRGECVSPEGGETDNLEIICGMSGGRKITLSGQENRSTVNREDMKTHEGGKPGMSEKHSESGRAN